MVDIHDREISYFFSVHQGKTEAVISLEEILIDSPQALEVALHFYKLVPGTNWAVGHHFMLYKGIGEDGNVIDEVIFSVTGYTEEGNFFRANINLSTMEVTGYDSGAKWQ